MKPRQVPRMKPRRVFHLQLSDCHGRVPEGWEDEPRKMSTTNESRRTGEPLEKREDGSGGQIMLQILQVDGKVLGFHECSSVWSVG